MNNANSSSSNFLYANSASYDGTEYTNSNNNSFQQEQQQQQQQHDSGKYNTDMSTSILSGPGSEDDLAFLDLLTNPIAGAAKFFSNTFRKMTGRLSEDEIKAKISKATELREKVNRSLARRVGSHVEPKSKRIFVGTWNVANQAPPPIDDMKIWLNGNSTVKPASADELPKIAVIGIQEATMSGAAMMLETTEAVAEWSEAFHSALHQLAKDAGHPVRYRKLDGVQLVGLIMLIFLPIDEFPHVRHLRTAVTRTGPLSAVGNKGAVGCRLTFHGKRLLFICGHFAPHEHNVKQRDHHYHSALDRLELSMPESNDDLADFILRLNPDTSLNGAGQDGGGIFSFGKSSVRGAGFAERIFHRREFRKLKNSTERSRALIHSHDYCFFFGDLNYRLVKGADQAMIKEMITHKKIRQLLQYDELYLGVKKGFIFEGFVEPPLRFLPTYKFAPETDLYDAVKRKPAWTDRVLVHCSGGEVDVEEHFQSNRTETYLLSATTMATTTHKNNNNDNISGMENEEELDNTIGFLAVDDARGAPSAAMLRQRSGSDFSGGSDVGVHSNKSTPPISPSSGPYQRGSNNNQNNVMNNSIFSNSSCSTTATTSPQHVLTSNNNNNAAGCDVSGLPSPLSLSPSLSTKNQNSNNNNCGENGTSNSALFPSSLAGPSSLALSNNDLQEKSGDDNRLLRNNHLNSNYKNNNDDDENNNNDDEVEDEKQSLNPQQKQLPRASASFEDFLASLDRCSNKLNSTVENHMSVQWYCSVPSLRMSDHRPVASAFDITVAFLSKEQQEILVFDTKQEVGLDFLDELTYAL